MIADPVPPSPPRSHGLTLALGGGGARGLAHIGVLSVLHREGIRVRALAGASMGALVGALYAAGIPPAEMEREAKRLSALREMVRLVDVGLGLGGIALRGEKITEYLGERIGRELRVEELHLPWAAVAVDIRTGVALTLDRGPVLDAVRASISIPGVFEPVIRDGMRLVDGGIADNVPVGPARDLGRWPVVAVDVLPCLETNRPGAPPTVAPIRNPHLPGLVNDSVQAQLVMASALTACRLRAHPPELLLRPEMAPEISILAGFTRAEEIIAAGVDAAETALPQLHHLARDGD